MRHLAGESRVERQESRAVLVSPKQSRSNDNARCADWRVRFADRIDHSFAPALGGTQVDKQHLVFVVLDDLGKRMPAFGKIDRIKLTLENRVLQMIAEVPHGFEDFAKPPVIADVVGDEIGVSHGRVSR